MVTHRKSSLSNSAAQILLEEAAKKEGCSIKVLCEKKGVLGVQAYHEYATTGFVQRWLEEWCFELMHPGVHRRATNLLGGVEAGAIHHPIMGLGEDLEMDVYGR